MTDRATYKFSNIHSAWSFVHACDEVGIQAGYPGLKCLTVQIPTQKCGERADRLAKEFAGVLAESIELVD